MRKTSQKLRNRHLTEEQLDVNNLVQSPPRKSGDIKLLQYVDVSSKPLDKDLVCIAQVLLSRGRARNFIVIDDYPYNINAIQILFRRIGITVEGATSGEQGLQRIIEMQTEQPYYEIAFVDINMPGMDGLEVTRRLRSLLVNERIKPLKIIQCTAYSSAEDSKNSIDAGADSFTTKPLTYANLRREIEKIYQIDS
jgi:CheY-like chemotaxis protein